jgi:PHD/YefM family antitoxin component YafN of YafNO toxin-antitoxin module
MKTQFITDSKGHKVAVVLPVKEYEKMLSDLEDLEDIRLYDQAKSSKEVSIPIEEAFKKMDAKRKRK